MMITTTPQGYRFPRFLAREDSLNPRGSAARRAAKRRVNRHVRRLSRCCIRLFLAGKRDWYGL